MHVGRECLWQAFGFRGFEFTLTWECGDRRLAKYSRGSSPGHRWSSHKLINGRTIRRIADYYSAFQTRFSITQATRFFVERL